MSRAVDDRVPTRQQHPEFLPGIVFAFTGLVLLALAWRNVRLPAALVRLLFELSGLLLITSAGFISAYVSAKTRERGARDRKVFVRRGGRRLPPFLEKVRSGSDKIYVVLVNFDWRGSWLAIVLVLLLCALAFLALTNGWRLANAPSTALFNELSAGILIALAFPLLVLERKFSALTERTLLEGPFLGRLLRLPLLGLVALSVAALLRWLGLPFTIAIEHGVALVAALVAAEFCLRSLVFFFVPLPPLEERGSPAQSFVVNLMRLQRPSLTAMSASVTRQFGIDLSRSWALGFIRRSAFPVLLGLAISAWLLTGVTALDTSQRAVYEAFGRPQAVFHSGLHVYLPWPLGELQPIEYGAVREIPIVFPAEDGTSAEPEAATVSSDDPIEGIPPEGVDRLWDASHPSEASYLVASNRNGHENFEIVNIDLRIIYRVGLSDKAAYNAIYRIESPDSLIRAAAGRMLARYFARYTILDVLGQNRAAFIRGFQKELQSRLDTLSSGVDILGVVIEAIHPPADAANAYQDVEASTIRSITLVAIARGDATRAIHEAETEATRMRDGAAAEATEMVDQAKVDTALFAGDVQAYHQDGAAFLFERRLGAIQKAMRPETAFTIVDHRIPQDQMPILDLRPPGSASLSGSAGHSPSEPDDDN